MAEEGSTEDLISSSRSNETEERSVRIEPVADAQREDRHSRWTLTPSLRLCISHAFSTWGDRMWRFLIGLILVELTPNSLRLTATYGLVISLSGVMFGPMVGNWVDAKPRLKVATTTLISQNSLVVVCAGFLLLLLQVSSLSDAASGLLKALVIVFAALANLASLGTQVAVEKDWVVVIAGNDKTLLAGTNAKMRRIDLTCMILAPLAVGQIMTYVSQSVAVIFLAVWNIVSVFLEYYLIWNVYKHVPELAHKRVDLKRHSAGDSKAEYIQANTSREDVSFQEGNEEEHGDDNSLVPDVNFTSTSPSLWKKLVNNLISFKNGWKIYMKQRVARAGLSLACLYMTVLGFSSITQGYAYTQGLSESILSVCYGLGALSGITGTFIFPQLHKRVGLVRSGLISMAAQFCCLLFCVFSIVAPGNPGIHLFKTVVVPQSGQDIPTVAPSHNIHRREFGFLNIAMDNSSVTPVLFSSPFLSQPVQATTMQNVPSVAPTPNSTFSQAMFTTFLPVPSLHVTPSQAIHPSPTQFIPIPSSSVSSTNTSSQNTTNSPPSLPKKSLISISLFMLGLITSRMGLYTSDLAISQLMQETVPEVERGIVGGMQTTFNSAMDFLHYILAIAFPSPEQFGFLIILSVMMVGVGGILYASFSYKMRGHLFHLDRVTQWCSDGTSESTTTRAGRTQSDVLEEEGMFAGISSVRNENFENEQLI